MSFRKSRLAIAVTFVVGLGVAQQADAYVYGRSYTKIDNLSVVLSDDGGATTGGGFVRGFNFNLTDTASLNGADVIDTATCSGTITPVLANNCNPGANSGLPTPGTRLDANIVTLGTGLPAARLNNVFVPFGGPGGGEFATADSVVTKAELTGDGPSSTEQIAEAQLISGTSASALSEVTSTTGFTFAFTVVGANQLAISFNALGDYLAAIANPLGTNENAQANTKFQLTLSKDGFFGVGGVFSPSGNTATDCAGAGGVTCLASLDQFDLNTDVGVSTDPNSSGRSNTAASDDFSMVFGGLTDGEWTLTLTSQDSVSLTQTVPVPGLLSLMGLGLAGLGWNRRRSARRG